MNVIDRLTAIAKRDLDDRTISPGDAHDLLDLIEAAQAIKQGICACIYHETWVPCPSDEIGGGYNVRGDLASRCSQCTTHEALTEALEAVASRAGNGQAAMKPAGEAPKLTTIGYDVVLIDELAGKIYRLVEREHDHTPLRRSRRGRWFEVKLPDSRIARVTIELDRVDPDA